MKRSTIALNCLAVFFLSKVIFIFEYLFSVRILQLPFNVLHDLTTHWDSSWYLSIVKEGYMTASLTNKMANYAFFPFFPLLVKLVTFTGLSPELAAVLLNQIQLLLAFYVLYCYVESFIDPKIALFTVILLAISSENVYFSIVYAEATFLLWSLLAFYNLRKGNYLISAFCIALLSATKIFGCLFVIPFIFHRIRFASKGFNFNEVINLILQSIICISGLLLFMAYLQMKVNDGLAFYHVQIAWGKLQTNWLGDFSHTLINLVKQSQLQERIFFIEFIIVAVALFRYKLYSEFLIVTISMFLSMISGSLTSFGRDLMVLFPVYITLAKLTYKSQILSSFLLIALSIFNAMLYLYLIVG